MLRSLGVEIDLPWGLEQTIERFAYESALAEALLSAVLYFVHDHFVSGTGDADIPWMYDLSDVPICVDTDNGATDSWTNGCFSSYYPYSCGSLDTETFQSNDMCCSCGGGS